MVWGNENADASCPCGGLCAKGDEYAEGCEGGDVDTFVTIDAGRVAEGVESNKPRIS